MWMGSGGMGWWERMGGGMGCVREGGEWRGLLVLFSLSRLRCWNHISDVCRLNERLRFLKYGEGQFFKPHCDSCYNAPDKSLKSFLTLHLYLNDSTPSTQDADPTAPPQVLKKGGATRFWSPEKDQYLDVEPKRGRVLVFQQRMLLHSGEAVEEGIKMTMRSDLMYEWTPYERASEVEKGKGVERVVYNPMNL